MAAVDGVGGVGLFGAAVGMAARESQAEIGAGSLDR